MSKWTHNNIPDQHGKIIIVTGANSGLGYESTLALARKGATVIMASRNLEKAAQAADQIRTLIDSAELDVIQLDLADLSSIHNFVEAFGAKYDQLDVLLNNAGMMATPYTETTDGFELQLGINHLGHFALTGLLLPLLKATSGSRVVNVSSLAANSGAMKFDDLMSQNSYSRFGAYSQSKLANLLFTNELKRRLAEAKIDVMAVAAHPGGSKTNLGSGMQLKGIVAAAASSMQSLMTQSAAMGALPQLYAATASDVDSGEYFGPDGIGGVRGFPKRIAMPKQAYSPQDARDLWQRSVELTQITYAF